MSSITVTHTLWMKNLPAGDDVGEDGWSNEDKLRMKQNIVRLMEASGDEVASRNLDRTSLLGLFDNFLVGTETRKKWKQKIRTPPKPSELGPIAAMKFVSTEKQFVSVTALRVEESTNETVSTNGTIHDNICEQHVYILSIRTM